MKRFILTITLLAFVSTMIHAQSKVGIFVPGYSLNPNVAWLNSGTPDRLVNEGILDSYRVLSVPEFGSLSSMTTPYSTEAAQAQQSQRWMVIGHSLGGLVARIAEHHTLLSLYNSFNVQLKGIVTLGAPHQGLPIARPNPQAPDIIQAFNNDVLAGPTWEYQHGSWLDATLTQLIGGEPYYQRLSNLMNSAKVEAANVVRQLSRYPLSEVTQLAPGGGFISSLQSISATVPHISIGGVESSPAIVRWWFSTDVTAGSSYMAENNAATLFYLVKDAYNASKAYNSLAEDWYYLLWQLTPCWLFPETCNELWQQKEYFKAGKNAWNRGLISLNGIDNTWWQLSNEYLEATGSYQYWVACGGEQPLSVNPGADLPMVPYNPCDYGATGYWETVYYTYYYADKSDALVPQNRTQWFANEGFANPNASVSAVRQGNISFDGGYNNSEMRYLERPHPPYDPSQPMQYARSWIAFWIIQP